MAVGILVFNIVADWSVDNMTRYAIPLDICISPKDDPTSDYIEIYCYFPDHHQGKCRLHGIKGFLILKTIQFMLFLKQSDFVAEYWNTNLLVPTFLVIRLFFQREYKTSTPFTLLIVVHRCFHRFNVIVTMQIQYNQP